MSENTTNPQEPRVIRNKGRNARRTALKKMYKLRESQLGDSSPRPTNNVYLTGMPNTTQNITPTPNNIHLTGKKMEMNKSNHNFAPIIPSFNQNNYNHSMQTVDFTGDHTLNMPGPYMTGPYMGGANIHGTNMGGPSMVVPNTHWPNMAGPGFAVPDMAGPNMVGPNMAGPYITGPNMIGPYMTEPNMTGTYMTEPNMVGPNMAGVNMTGPNMTGPNIGSPNMTRPNLNVPSQPGSQNTSNIIPLTGRKENKNLTNKEFKKLKNAAYIAKWALNRKGKRLNQSNPGHTTPDVTGQLSQWPTQDNSNQNPFQPNNQAAGPPNQYGNQQKNQPKKKKKNKQPKPPKIKKEKWTALTKEEKMRRIEEKYKQAVFIHRLVTSQPKPEPPPKKPKVKAKPQHNIVDVKVAQPVQTQKQGLETAVAAKTTQPGPNLKQEPVETVATEQVKQNVNNTVPSTPPGQTVEQLPLFPRASNRKRTRSKKNKNQNAYNQANVYSSSSNQAKATSSGQYQAPHQDEPEDLTDDLAPNMGQGGQAGTQARTAGAENKLNFKFQRSVPKNPDWSEYQNKFRRIGGGSPDPEPAPGEKEVKQEPGQSTGFLFEEDVEMKEVNIKTEIDTSDLKVAVTTRPYLYLNEERVKEIEEALVNKIQDAIFNQQLSYIPTFEDIPVHNLGYLPLKCRGPEDLIWLHKILPTIPAPVPDVKLVIKPEISIPNMVKVKLFIPNYSGNLEELRYLLQKQNHWYDMSTWLLVKSEKQGDDPSNYSLEYRVPEKQALIIDNRDRRVAYSLGTCLAIVSDDVIDTENVFKYRNIAQHLQVSIVTEPFRYLTLLEVEMIKLALIYKLEKDVNSDNGYIPTFRGCPCHYKGGLKMWCESDRDLKWLKDAVNSLVSPAIGTKLTIKELAAIPQRAKMIITVPTNEEESYILKVLKRQNSWCDVDSWTLFSTYLDQNSRVVCVFYVPNKHIRLIKERNCRLSFLLGYVKADITAE